MSDCHRRKRKGVSQSEQQTNNCFNWATRFVVAVNKNQRAQKQRHHTRHRRVLLRLRHFIVFQNRFACQPRVDAGDFRPRLLHQSADAFHRRAVQVIARRVRGDEKNFSVIERDVSARRGFVTRREQRRDARRWRRAGPFETFRRLLQNAVERRQRFYQRIILRIRLVLGRAELRVDQFKKGNQIRRLRKFLDERQITLQRVTQTGEVTFWRE